MFSEALLELRAEFIESIPDQTLPVLLTDQHNPFLAVALSFADYPSTLGPTRDHIIGAGVTAGVRRRLENTHRLDTTTDIDVEAKARAFVLMCVQLGNGIYRRC